MNKEMRQLICFSFLLLFPLKLLAQADLGIWYSAVVEKKISKKWSIGVEGELRTRNNSRTFDRWNLGIEAEYKIIKNIKASVGYVFLNDNNMERISRNKDGSYNNWYPSYWGTRHRLHLDLIGSLAFGQLKFSLRERWQYTYRNSKQLTRFDFDHYKYETKDVGGTGKNILRSRLQMSLDIPHSKIEPYANVELFNSWKLAKIRYTLGGEWKLTKQHCVGLYYRYQDIRQNAEDGEPNSHVMGVDYKFEF